jgi:hypothetical protein
MSATTTKGLTVEQLIEGVKALGPDSPASTALAFLEQERIRQERQRIAAEQAAQLEQQEVELAKGRPERIKELRAKAERIMQEAADAASALQPGDVTKAALSGPGAEDMARAKAGGPQFREHIVGELNAALRQVCDELMRLECDERGRAHIGYAFRHGLPTTMDELDGAIAAAFERDDEAHAVAEARREQGERYDEAMAEYQKQKREHEAHCLEHGMSAEWFVPKLSDEQWDALNPAGGMPGSHKRRTTNERPKQRDIRREMT